MYESLLTIHSWLRWGVLIVLVIFFLKSLVFALRQKPWQEKDGFLPFLFEQIFGSQLLLGLALWIGLSPFTKEALRHFSQITDNPLVEFWALRHPLTMLFAFGLWRASRVWIKRRGNMNRHRDEAIALGALILVIFSAVPWPWLAIGRPFWRSLF